MVDWNPTWKEPTDAEIDAQIEAARVASDERRATEVHALAVRYDRAARRVMIDLSNAAVFIFPVDRVQGLQGAADEDLALVEVNPLGDGIDWPRLDWHHSLSALLVGRFGSKTWMEREHASQHAQPRTAEG